MNAISFDSSTFFEPDGNDSGSGVHDKGLLNPLHFSFNFMCRGAGFQHGIADRFGIYQDSTLSCRVKAVRALECGEHIAEVDVAMHDSRERVAPVAHEHVDVWFSRPVIRSVIKPGVIRLRRAALPARPGLWRGLGPACLPALPRPVQLVPGRSSEQVRLPYSGCCAQRVLWEEFCKPGPGHAKNILPQGEHGFAFYHDPALFAGMAVRLWHGMRSHGDQTQSGGPPVTYHGPMCTHPSVVRIKTVYDNEVFGRWGNRREPAPF